MLLAATTGLGAALRDNGWVVALTLERLGSDQVIPDPVPRNLLSPSPTRDTAGAWLCHQRKALTNQEKTGWESVPHLSRETGLFLCSCAPLLNAC